MSLAGRPSVRGNPANELLRNLYGQTDGQRIPGGCDHCNAEQALIPQSDGCWIMRTYHDDDCPFLAKYRGES